MKRFLSVFLVIFAFFFFPLGSYAEDGFVDLLADIVTTGGLKYCVDTLVRSFDSDSSNDLSDLEKSLMKAERDLVVDILSDPQKKREYYDMMNQAYYLADDRDDIPDTVVVPFVVSESLLKDFTGSFLQHSKVDVSDMIVGDFPENALSYMKSLDFSLNRDGNYTNIVILKNYHDGKVVSVSTYFNVSVVGNIMTARKNEGSLMVVDSYVPWLDDSGGKSVPIDTWWVLSDTSVVIPNASIRTSKEKYFDDVVKPFLSKMKNPHIPAPSGSVVLNVPLKKSDLVRDSYDQKKYKINPFLYEKKNFHFSDSKNLPSPNQKPDLVFAPGTSGPSTGPSTGPTLNYPFPNAPSSDKPSFPGQDPENPDDPDIPKLDFSPLYVPVPQKFPFCIPFDLVNSLQIFKTQVEGTWEPYWVIPWATAQIEVDLRQFSVLAKIVRYFVLWMFIVGLINVTRGLIRG